METLSGKYLVAKWGYSMILATWVRIIKESPKTLLVEEVRGRALTSEELAQYNLHPMYLQSYSVATNEPTGHNGYLDKPFRLYKRDGKLSGVDAVWRGRPKGMSISLTFISWEGKPEFEDHCD